MFGAKKNEPGTSTGQSTSSNNASNIINSGTTIEGTITSQGDIRIDGSLIGNLESKGKVIIGPEGKLEGILNCVNAVIEGTFTGDLQCSDLLNIKETAIVNGDINTDKLMVQPGAIYNVSCKMGSSGIKTLSQPTASAEAS